MTEPLLSLRGLTVRFPAKGGPLEAVRGVDLDIAPGEVLALVGESGSGKSALARGLLRLNQAPFSRHAAEVRGEARLQAAAGPLDLVAAPERRLRDVRARDVAMIFQDALSALNPVMRIGRQIGEALARRFPAMERPVRRDRVMALLGEVGLDDAARLVRAYPHQLSGGQRQRVMIAIAMARQPALMIADEPTTALDVTVQARVLAQLRTLQRRHAMAMLFITHDLSLVPKLADRVAVMYAGRLVEIGQAEAVFAAPRHPYTRGLLDSRPGHRRHGAGLTGAAPDPRGLPPGCAFAPRCRQAGPDCDMTPALTDGVRCVRPLAGPLA